MKNSWQSETSNDCVASVPIEVGIEEDDGGFHELMLWLESKESPDDIMKSAVSSSCAVRDSQCVVDDKTRVATDSTTTVEPPFTSSILESRVCFEDDESHGASAPLRTKEAQTKSAGVSLPSHGMERITSSEAHSAEKHVVDASANCEQYTSADKKLLLKILEYIFLHNRKQHTFSKRKLQTVFADFSHALDIFLAAGFHVSKDDTELVFDRSNRLQLVRVHIAIVNGSSVMCSKTDLSKTHSTQKTVAKVRSELKHEMELDSDSDMKRDTEQRPSVSDRIAKLLPQIWQKPEARRSAVVTELLKILDNVLMNRDFLPLDLLKIEKKFADCSSALCFLLAAGFHKRKHQLVFDRKNSLLLIQARVALMLEVHATGCLLVPDTVAEKCVTQKRKVVDSSASAFVPEAEDCNEEIEIVEVDVSDEMRSAVHILSDDNVEMRGASHRQLTPPIVKAKSHKSMCVPKADCKLVQVLQRCTAEKTVSSTETGAAMRGMAAEKIVAEKKHADEDLSKLCAAHSPIVAGVSVQTASDWFLSDASVVSSLESDVATTARSSAVAAMSAETEETKCKEEHSAESGYFGTGKKPLDEDRQPTLFEASESYSESVGESETDNSEEQESEESLRTKVEAKIRMECALRLPKSAPVADYKSEGTLETVTSATVFKWDKLIQKISAAIMENLGAVTDAVYQMRGFGMVETGAAAIGEEPRVEKLIELLELVKSHSEKCAKIAGVAQRKLRSVADR